MNKVSFFLIPLILVVFVCSWGWADQLAADEVKALSEEEIQLKMKELHEDRIVLMKNSRLDGPRILLEEVDFLGELLDRMLKTANVIVALEKADKGYVGLEFSFYESPSKKWDIIWGFVPDDGRQFMSYGGVEFKNVPLVGQLSEVFERLDVAILYCSDSKARLGLSYRWRSEEQD